MINYDDFPLPSVEKSEEVFKFFGSIIEDRLKLPCGMERSYYKLQTTKEAVMVLAQTPDQKFILNLEYRHPCKEVLLGCPGGLVEDGENSLEAGKRELLEETGYQVDDLKLIGESFPFSGFSTQKIIYYHGMAHKERQKPQREPMELIKTILLSKEEIHHYIQQGKPLDGVLATALLHLSLAPS